MNTWDRFYLSPEFYIVITLIAFLVLIALLLFSIIKYLKNHNRKTEVSSEEVRYELLLKALLAKTADTSKFFNGALTEEKVELLKQSITAREEIFHEMAELHFGQLVSDWGSSNIEQESIETKITELLNNLRIVQVTDTNGKD